MEVGAGFNIFSLRPQASNLKRIKLINLIRRVWLLLILFCIYGCSNFVKAAETNLLNEVVGTETNGFKLSISTPAHSFIAGQEIDLAVLQKSILTNSVTVMGANNLMYYEFEVVGPDGRKLNPTESGNQWMSPETFRKWFGESVGPGQAFVRSIPISKFFIMTNPGCYTVSVELNLTHTTKISAGPLKVLVVNRSIPNSLHK